MPESYPTLPAGIRLRASLMRSMLPQEIRKTADEQRQATTTFTDDLHLVFPAEVNAVYEMRGWIKYFADPTPDIKIQFSVPTGCLGEWGWLMPGSGTLAAGTAGYSIRTETNDVAQFRTGYGTSDSNHMVPMGGLFRMGSTAGNIALQWAQNTSSATATTLFTDSFLVFTRTA